MNVACVMNENDYNLTLGFENQIYDQHIVTTSSVTLVNDGGYGRYYVLYHYDGRCTYHSSDAKKSEWKLDDD